MFDFKVKKEVFQAPVDGSGFEAQHTFGHHAGWRGITPLLNLNRGIAIYTNRAWGCTPPPPGPGGLG